MTHFNQNDLVELVWATLKATPIVQQNAWFAQFFESREELAAAFDQTAIVVAPALQKFMGNDQAPSPEAFGFITTRFKNQWVVYLLTLVRPGHSSIYVSSGILKTAPKRHEVTADAHMTTRGPKTCYTDLVS